MERTLELPPHGKPYYLLTNIEVERFNFYRENGGRFGIKVRLKTIQTENLGTQLIVIVRSIRADDQTLNKNDIVNAFSELNSARSDQSYTDRLSKTNTFKELIETAPTLQDKPMQIVRHQFSNTNRSKEIQLKLDGEQYIIAPKNFMDRVRILFGLY